ncbi:unnamed protein product [Oppiella nova]|uniref:Carboxylic ester hydrolase n=1 Tax=Oppiella nova TaxID=334625 RepID=A0A7R9M2M6_9ACAR|nr:unnamed protein product [Oppiella nova]CAG2169405.1 unnamed protein product [Oppiella nova]
MGSLRFAKPLPLLKPRKDIIDGTKHGNSCIQNLTPSFGKLTLSEDCLVLNIWTPNVGNNDESTEAPALKPVMFWIHGGGLVNGSIFQMPPYNGIDLAAYNVVVVSTNYRLGPFGFLYGDREDAPGNVGFYDQLLAIKWVRENIRQFGGDRGRITIFGESAGSRSVSSQILSPLSKGLFKRAIMQSGAHLYNMDREPLNNIEALSEAKQMAKHVNCSETEDWLQCLRKVDAKDILKLEKSFSSLVFGIEFLPVYTHKALDDHLLNYEMKAHFW